MLEHVVLVRTTIIY